MKKVFEGYLKYTDNGEGDDILYFLTFGETVPLAELLQEEIGNKLVTVRYYISDRVVSIEEAQQKFINQLFGVLDANYNVVYSEITGYLWTDQEINVGGHDLLEELATYHGKYLILEVEIHDDKKGGR
jgi:hypothetical protein